MFIKVKICQLLLDEVNVKVKRILTWS